MGNLAPNAERNPKAEFLLAKAGRASKANSPSKNDYFFNFKLKLPAISENVF